MTNLNFRVSEWDGKTLLDEFEGTVRDHAHLLTLLSEHGKNLTLFTEDEEGEEGSEVLLLS